VTVNGRLVVTFNEVGLAAAVAGLGPVSMTVGAARKEISEGLLVRVLADWHMGEVELHGVFPARKAAKPSVRAFVDLLASSRSFLLGRSCAPSPLGTSGHGAY
jgi:DNA-binding transcriptional LysR family regulator